MSAAAAVGGSTVTHAVTGQVTDPDGIAACDTSGYAGCVVQLWKLPRMLPALTRRAALGLVSRYRHAATARDPPRPPPVVSRAHLCVGCGGACGVGKSLPW